MSLPYRSLPVAHGSPQQVAAPAGRPRQQVESRARDGRREHADTPRAGDVPRRPSGRTAPEGARGEQAVHAVGGPPVLDLRRVPCGGDRDRGRAPRADRGVCGGGLGEGDARGGGVRADRGPRGDERDERGGERPGEPLPCGGVGRACAGGAVGPGLAAGDRPRAVRATAEQARGDGAERRGDPGARRGGVRGGARAARGAGVCGSAAGLRVSGGGGHRGRAAGRRVGGGRGRGGRGAGAGGSAGGERGERSGTRRGAASADGAGGGRRSGGEAAARRAAPGGDGGHRPLLGSRRGGAAGAGGGAAGPRLSQRPRAGVCGG